jgi:anthranilate phosphoribosyltransferase
MSRYDGVFYAPHVMSHALAGLVLPFKTDALLYGLSLKDVRLSIELFRHYLVTNPHTISSTIDGVHYVDEALPAGLTRIGSWRDKYHEEVYAFGDLLPFKPITSSSYSQANGGQRDNIVKGLLAILPGAKGDLSKTIALNAGTVLYTAGVTKSIVAGYHASLEQIAKGAAWSQLVEFTEASGGNVAVLSHFRDTGTLRQIQKRRTTV